MGLFSNVMKGINDIAADVQASKKKDFLKKNAKYVEGWKKELADYKRMKEVAIEKADTYALDKINLKIEQLTALLDGDEEKAGFASRKLSLIAENEERNARASSDPQSGLRARILN